MISLYTIITFMLCHWVFDFFFQTSEMAQGKSKSNNALLSHVQVYTIGLTVMAFLNCAYFQYSWSVALVWIAGNAVAHFFTDYVSSRASSLLYKDENYHDFFVTIGLDQFVHYATLFSSFYYVINNIPKA